MSKKKLSLSDEKLKIIAVFIKSVNFKKYLKEMNQRMEKQEKEEKIRFNEWWKQVKDNIYE